MEIKIVLTEAEAKALAYVAYSPQEWAENAVHERARIAMDEIFKLEIERMLSDPNTKEIPADREQVVLNANIKTVAELQAEAELNGTGLSS
jgi:hypothetical protein